MVTAMSTACARFGSSCAVATDPRTKRTDDPPEIRLGEDDTSRGNQSTHTESSTGFRRTLPTQRMNGECQVVMTEESTTSVP